MIIIRYKIPTDDTEHTAHYELADNAVSGAWERKIKRLQGVPFSSHYTGLDHQRKMDKAQILHEIQVSWRDLHTQGILGAYTGMTQTISNELHSWLVSNQYRGDYSQPQKELMHRLHRLIHAWELAGDRPHTFPVGWGEREGPLQEPLDPVHLALYQYPLTPGDLYLIWSEFGKRPYDLFCDGLGAEAVEECRAHETFRAKFDLALGAEVRRFDDGWPAWWREFRVAWSGRCDIEWTPLFQWGGIPVAHRVRNTADIVRADRVLAVSVATE